MPLSLRSFHLVFILVAIVMADMFGAWAVHEYVGGTGTPLTLALGIGTLVGGLALCVYAVFFVREMDAKGIL